jgi:Sec-independent protein translocase protein TatA
LNTKPSFVDRDMVMRHFGGGIGHIQSALNQDDEGIVSEGESMDTSDQTHAITQARQDTTDEDGGADDLDASDREDDSEMETSSSASSSSEVDESELDTDDDGYDSL